MSPPPAEHEEEIRRIIGEEIRRIAPMASSGEEDVVELDEEDIVQRLLPRIAMRAFHAGAAHVVAHCASFGLQLELDVRLDDEEGADLLLPPVGERG